MWSVVCRQASEKQNRAGMGPSKAADMWVTFQLISDGRRSTPREQMKIMLAWGFQLPCVSLFRISVPAGVFGAVTSHASHQGL